MTAKWLRPEFRGRDEELETRADFEKRTGISAQALSSRFTNYADRKPKLVKKFGKLKYFVAAELDEFVAWIEKNSGTRSDTDIRRAELARIDEAVLECQERIIEHERNAEKARRDLGKYQRQRRTKKEELEFLMQAP